MISSATPTSRWTRHGDRFGFWAAVVCAAHCALLPAALAAMPAVGLGASGSADGDQAFVVFAGLLGVFTIGVGVRRHRRWSAVGWLLAALLLLGGGAFGPWHAHGSWHAALMVGGGMLLAVAHLRNLRLDRHPLGL